MEVVLIKENEDGSADYTFDYTDEEFDAMLHGGIRLVLKEPEEHCGPQHKAAVEALVQLATITGIVSGVKKFKTGQNAPTSE